MTRRITQVAVLAAMAASAGFFAGAVPSSADTGTTVTQTKGFTPSDPDLRYRVGNRVMNFTTREDDLPGNTIGGGRGDGGNGGNGGDGGGNGGGGNGGGGEGGSPQ
ncbi:MAG: hypothetical protein AAGI06_05345 [Pseudomonadota bacterium]